MFATAFMAALLTISSGHIAVSFDPQAGGIIQQISYDGHNLLDGLGVGRGMQFDLMDVTHRPDSLTEGLNPTQGGDIFDRGSPVFDVEHKGNSYSVLVRALQFQKENGWTPSPRITNWWMRVRTVVQDPYIVQTVAIWHSYGENRRIASGTHSLWGVRGHYERFTDEGRPGTRWQGAFLVTGDAPIEYLLPAGVRLSYYGRWDGFKTDRYIDFPFRFTEPSQQSVESLLTSYIPTGEADIDLMFIGQRFSSGPGEVTLEPFQPLTGRFVLGFNAPTSPALLRHVSLVSSDPCQLVTVHFSNGRQRIFQSQFEAAQAADALTQVQIPNTNLFEWSYVGSRADFDSRFPPGSCDSQPPDPPPGRHVYVSSVVADSLAAGFDTGVSITAGDHETSVDVCAYKAGLLDKCTPVTLLPRTNFRRMLLSDDPGLATSENVDVVRVEANQPVAVVGMIVQAIGEGEFRLVMTPFTEVQ